MEDVIGVVPSESPAAAVTVDVAGGMKKNRIQVSNRKKPMFFYVNLAKRYMQQYEEVELSALGMAITTVVTISEILKTKGFATEEKILTSTVDMRDENNGRLVQKAKIEILLKKADNSHASTKTSSDGSTITADKAQQEIEILLKKADNSHASTKTSSDGSTITADKAQQEAVVGHKYAN